MNGQSLLRFVKAITGQENNNFFLKFYLGKLITKQPSIKEKQYD